MYCTGRLDALVKLPKKACVIYKNSASVCEGCFDSNRGNYREKP